MDIEETQDQTPATQAGDGMDFDDAWNEFTGSTSQPDDQPPVEEEEATPTEEADPVPETETETEETTPPEEADPLAAADEAATLRAELEAERHKRQSDSGRISAFQRKIQQLEERLSQSAQPKDKAGDEGGADRWDAFKNDYPDIAEALEARFGSLTGEVQEVKSQLTPLQQAHQENARNREFAALEAAHADWYEVSNSEGYRAWLETQPFGVQDLHKSSSAADASAVLTLYKTQHAPAQPQPDPAVARLQAERNRRLASAATTVPGKGSAVKPLASDNFEDAWDYFASKA